MFGVTPPLTHRERSNQSCCINYCGKFSSIEYGLNWDCISCFGAAAPPEVCQCGGRPFWVRETARGDLCTSTLLESVLHPDWKCQIFRQVCQKIYGQFCSLYKFDFCSFPLPLCYNGLSLLVRSLKLGCTWVRRSTSIHVCECVGWTKRCKWIKVACLRSENPRSQFATEHFVDLLSNFGHKSRAENHTRTRLRAKIITDHRF